MKYFFILLIHILFFIDNSYSVSRETGNGGAECAARFITLGDLVFEKIENIDYFRDEIQLINLKKRIETAKVFSTTEQLILRDTYVDAINYPIANKIYFNEKWCQQDYPNKALLVLHEYLGLIDSEIDSNYRISSKLNFLTGLDDIDWMNLIDKRLGSSSQTNLRYSKLDSLFRKIESYESNIHLSLLRESPRKFLKLEDGKSFDYMTSLFKTFEENCNQKYSVIKNQYLEKYSDEGVFAYLEAKNNSKILSKNSLISNFSCYLKLVITGTKKVFRKNIYTTKYSRGGIHYRDIKAGPFCSRNKEVLKSSVNYSNILVDKLFSKKNSISSYDEPITEYSCTLVEIKILRK